MGYVVLNRSTNFDPLIIFNLSSGLAATAGPQFIEAFELDNVTMYCTNKNYVIWTVGENTRIFYRDSVQTTYVERVFKGVGNGFYNITLVSVSVADTNIYTCCDIFDENDCSSVSLNVTGVYQTMTILVCLWYIYNILISDKTIIFFKKSYYDITVCTIPY